MAGFNGRRGPNVSQYLANLNTVPIVPDPAPAADPLNIEEDLALFTNTDFLDWDGADFDINQPVDYDHEAEQRARRLNASGTKNMQNNNGTDGVSKPMDFINGDFQFPDFNGFQDSVIDQSGLTNLPQSQANNFPMANYPSSVSNSASPVSPQFDQVTTGKKRKLDVDPNSQQALDEQARVAAEEDKRRRNTAASARFRVKKKQREQALEKTAKEMSDRVNVLETKVTQLETENSWLKSLITEKNGSGKSPDLNAMYKKFMESNTGERSNGQRTDGVGTVAQDVKADA